MSAVIDTAVEQLSAKLADGFDGVAKFVIEGEGAIMLDASGVVVPEAGGETGSSASVDVFKAILDGEMNPTMAFMTGKLSVDGSMGLAMKLAAVL